MILNNWRSGALAGGVLMLCAAGWSPEGEKNATTAASNPVATTVEAATIGAAPQSTVKPLAAFQLELLELAFNTASAIPLDPHVKDRSKAQEAVVAACLRLNQPDRAMAYAQQILDWRHGSALADCALYFAQHDRLSDALNCIEKSSQVADVAEDWRRDRIRVKIAQSYEWLGQSQQAIEFASDVVPAETGKVASIKAMRDDENTFDDQVQELDAAIAIGNLDLTRNALDASAHLFERFYADQAKRTMAEDKIRSSWSKLPPTIRIDLVMTLANSAVGQRDTAKANEELDSAWEIMKSLQWAAEDQVPMMARLAQIRAAAGEKDKAKSEADAAFSLYESDRDTIVNIYRAQSLRPLAEAYQALGDSSLAGKVYRQAIADGVENPNSRPRAEDLSATCCSMAVSGFEPDAIMWTRIREIQNGLSDPW